MQHKVHHMLDTIIRRYELEYDTDLTVTVRYHQAKDNTSTFRIFIGTIVSTGFRNQYDASSFRKSSNHHNKLRQALMHGTEQSKNVRSLIGAKKLALIAKVKYSEAPTS
jgi:hypothetical protein